MSKVNTNLDFNIARHYIFNRYADESVDIVYESLGTNEAPSGLSMTFTLNKQEVEILKDFLLSDKSKEILN